jgi:hypothetical protein
MRKIAMTVLAAALTSTSFLTAQSANAANVEPSPAPTPVYSRPMNPAIVGLDCVGTTGRMGCGPGWIWRDGWRGWACYPC